MTLSGSLDISMAPSSVSVKVRTGAHKDGDYGECSRRGWRQGCGPFGKVEVHVSVGLPARVAACDRVSLASIDQLRTSSVFVHALLRRITTLRTGLHPSPALIPA